MVNRPETQGSGVLCTEADFYDLMIAYLRRAAADNIRYTEVSFDPQTHSSKMLNTVARGLNLSFMIIRL